MFFWRQVPQPFLKVRFTLGYLRGVLKIWRCPQPAVPFETVRLYITWVLNQTPHFCSRESAAAPAQSQGMHASTLCFHISTPGFETLPCQCQRHRGGTHHASAGPQTSHIRDSISTSVVLTVITNWRHELLESKITLGCGSSGKFPQKFAFKSYGKEFAFPFVTPTDSWS